MGKRAPAGRRWGPVGVGGPEAARGEGSSGLRRPGVRRPGAEGAVRVRRRKGSGRGVCEGACRAQGGGGREWGRWLSFLRFVVRAWKAEPGKVAGLLGEPACVD